MAINLYFLHNYRARIEPKLNITTATLLVAADNEPEARNFACEYSVFNGDYWTMPEFTSCQHVGMALSEIKKGVIREDDWRY